MSLRSAPAPSPEQYGRSARSREALGLRPARGTAVATPRVSPSVAQPVQPSRPGTPTLVTAAPRPAATGPTPLPDPPPVQQRPKPLVVAFPLLVADDEPVEATGGIGARLWIAVLAVLVAVVVLAAVTVAASAWFRATGFRWGT